MAPVSLILIMFLPVLIFVGLAAAMSLFDKAADTASVSELA